MQLHNILALDVGEKRIGVALARKDLNIPIKLDTLSADSEDIWEVISQLVDEYEIKEIVVGLPRGLNGQETNQTKYVRNFGEELARKTGLELHWQDEALTSINAQEILAKTDKPYSKGDIDAIAACIILDDYLQTKGAMK